MRGRLGLLLVSVALVASACGSSSSTATAEPTGSPVPTDSSSEPSAGPIEGAHVLPLVSIPAVAGRVSQRAVPLGSPAQVAEFVQQFPAPTVVNRVRAALQPALSNAGPNVVGAVVASGCDVPPGVMVSADGAGGVTIVAQQPSSHLQECLVPVTTVALVELPRD